MGRYAIATYAALACLLPPGTGTAQEPDRIVIDAGHAIARTEGDTVLTLLTGRMSVRRLDFEITAERAMVWQKKGSLRPVDEIYAEGQVVLKRGTQTLRADRLYFDFVGDRAVILDLRIQGHSGDLLQTFYVSAPEARVTMAGRMEADQVSLSSCSYGVPHYHLSVQKATLLGRYPRPRKEEDVFDFWPFDDWQVRMEDVTPELGGAPVFFLPGLLLGSWVKDFPVRSIQYGRTSRFGNFVLSEFGRRIHKSDGRKDRPWGEVILEADWREKRGGAWGLDLDYKWKDYSGYIDTYFLHDYGRDEEISFDALLEATDPLRRSERGRARTFHRHDLDDAWRLELEAGYASDPRLIEEFFEKEFKEDKVPETAAYVRWRDGPMGGYLYERHRINDFETINEYLPRLELWFLEIPPGPGVLDAVRFTERWGVAHLRRRFDERLDLPSEEAWRMDAVSELALPWDLGIFQVSPYLQQRLTVYDEDLEGETEFRSLWTAGGRFATQVHATHPGIAWDGVGLRGLRHVAELEVRYANTVDANVPPEELFPFEGVEELGEFEEVALELRQRFLTRNAHGKPFEFLSLVGGIEFYPDSDRDTRGVKVTNFTWPFNWISLAPTTGAGTFERRHWSNVHSLAALRPSGFLSVSAGGEYNPVTRHEETRDLAVGLSPMPELSLNVTRTFVRGTTDAYGIGGSWSLSEKWLVSGSLQYDFRMDEYIRQNLVVSRDFHDFMIQAILERDFGRDERRMYLAVVPKFLGKGSPKAIGGRSGAK